MKKRKWAFPLWLFNSALLLSTIITLYDTVFYFSWQNFIRFLISSVLWFLTSLIIIVATYKGLSKIKRRKKIEPLSYTFVDNSILLTTETIERNGFRELLRQTNSEHSVQILCFNPDTNEFQAFDRYHWMDEPYYVSYPEGVIGELPTGLYYKRDLWTPIKLHFTLEWLEERLMQ